MSAHEIPATVEPMGGKLAERLAELEAIFQALPDDKRAALVKEGERLRQEALAEPSAIALAWLGGVLPDTVRLRLKGQEVTAYMAARHPLTFIGPNVMHLARHDFDARQIAGRLARNATADVQLGSGVSVTAAVLYVPSLKVDMVVGAELAERLGIVPAGGGG